MLGPFLCGVGWLNGLAWLPRRRLRRYMQHSKSKPINTANPMMEPTTIPAICPPFKPPEVPVTAPDAVGKAVEVEDGNNGGTENIGGKVTPSHRVVTSDATQQESVAFGELDAQ
jgi:hypothetical protein